MATLFKTLKICEKGHRYYKSSECPTCPVCAEEGKATQGFTVGLSAPAQRALDSAGIKTTRQLAQKTEAEILALHGMGPASMPKLRQALADEGLAFTAGVTPIKKVRR
jgi:predicted RecB family nuclease